MTDTVTKLLAAIEAGQPVPSDLLAEDIVLDATVPDWRMRLRGTSAVLERYGAWFADPGHFEELTRTPMPGGEIVRFLLSWTENGVPMAARQAHFYEIDDSDRITRDEMFCGGRWDAGRLAEMEAADRVSA
jgi:hypothetical protein